MENTNSITTKKVDQTQKIPDIENIDTGNTPPSEAEKLEKEKLEKEKLEKTKKAKEKLVFSTPELEYMQSISSLFGKTPRSINRYVNIYRIIKAHGNLKVTDKYSEEEYKPVMFLLGVIVGYSSFAKDFIDKILKSDDSQKFGVFLEGSSLNKDFKTLLDPFTAAIDDLSMENFKSNLELISRFSFRTLLTES